jgi:hypothetical protein
MMTAADELLAIHLEDQAAHLATDVGRVLAYQGEPFVTVANGVVETATRAEVETFFTRYFAGAAYDEYADLEPPRVEVSADGTLGWVISRTRIRRVTRRFDGTLAERQFVYAGLMGYARRDGRWRRIANVSTFEPV